MNAQQGLLLIAKCANIQAQWGMHWPRIPDAATGVELAASWCKAVTQLGRNPPLRTKGLGFRGLSPQPLSQTSNRPEAQEPWCAAALTHLSSIGSLTPRCCASGVLLAEDLLSLLQHMHL